MLTLHIRRHSATLAYTSRTQAAHEAAHRSAVLRAAIEFLTAHPYLSERDIARGYPLVITDNPRRAMH